MPLLLRNARLVLDPPRGVREGWILIEGGVIIGMGLDERESPGGVASEDCEGDFLTPGLIDLHLHGACGRDAMEATEDAYEVILRAHAMKGTTSALLTTVTAPQPAITQVVKTARSWRDREGVARLLGIHLEGPWFSTRRCGAHDPSLLRSPEVTELDELMASSPENTIRRVTLAPEIPGALGVIRDLVSAGIAVSAGHSDATEEESLCGFAAGITQVTHLHNAMSSLRKTEPPRRGLAEAALAKEGILCELIADGVHVPPELLREAVAAKEWQGIALVSDATAGAVLPEGSPFLLGSLACRVGKDAAHLLGSRQGCLAGSTKFLFDGMRTMVETGAATMCQAVAMSTITPSRALGMEGEIGSLGPGMRADLLRFSGDWEIRDVWIDGRKAVAG